MDRLTLQCIGVTKAFGGNRILDDVTLELEPGRVTALVGPNGAGKSTLFNLFGGLFVPDKGQVWYAGERIDGLQSYVVARRGIGRLFQDVRVFTTLTALENVLIGSTDRDSEGPSCPFLRPRRTAREESKARSAAHRWLDIVGLGDGAAYRAGELSYGQQKLVAIARLLASSCGVLLLDEPTAGLEAEVTSSINKLLKSVACEGKAVAIVEHNMRVVTEIADRVYFLESGRIAAVGTPGEILENPTIQAAYLGL